MDVLRAEAVQLLQKLPFEANDQYEVIHIKSSQTDYANVVLEERTLNDVELQAFMADSPSQSDIISTKMVRMHYHPDGGITSNSSSFRSLWHAFHLDPYMIYMFHRNVPGFFQLPSTSPGDPVLRFYVNCQAHWLFWSYHPSIFSTKVVVLSRRSPGGPSAYPHLHARLKDYSVLAGHPLFPAVATAVERLSYVDVFLRQQHKRIGIAEMHTGFSHFHIHMPRRHVQDSEAELDNLSNLSRSASSVLVGLADMQQHLQCSTTLIDAMLNSNFAGAGRMPGNDLMARRETEIKEIANILSPQIKQRYGYVTYIKERAQNQVSVIFNLLARGDAQANIDIAKAVMHDSTSMKTVAIMTMVFLPATFYAALFAVPSLQWDKPSIIGDRFWIYWAVTIPTTILVLVVWFAISHRDEIWERVSQKSRKTGEKLDGEKLMATRLDTFAAY